MSYQVLARKWRPRQFRDMVGQEAILTMLSNALSQQRLHHAYLFTGTRGVGKTTLGRIFAKCLNCETGITASPCDQCQFCKAIDAGKFLDLYEIDAASRTKVEDTRELLDNVLYAPTQGRYKIYLIDEVHMLSNHSFNALLKTLEEPPSHVKFLLATTDPKRIPITILSRCLQFHLKPIHTEDITTHLIHISKAEDLSYEIPGLEKLAIAAKGSMRDALSLLDQAIAYGKGHVKLVDVRNMLGTIPFETLIPILTALSEQNGQNLFATIQAIAEHGPDYNQLLEELISLLHQIAIIQIVPEAMVVDKSIEALAKQLAPEDVQIYYQIALLAKRDLAYTPTPKQGFEMTMLRMLAFRPEKKNVTKSKKEKSAIEKKVINITDAKDEPYLEQKNTQLNKEMFIETLVTNESNSVDWRELLPKLELSGMAFALASNCTLTQFIGDKMVLALSKSHEPMLNTKLKERIASGLERHFKMPISLDINITTDDLFTPMKQNLQENTARLDAAQKELLDNPKIKELIEMYDASVEVSLLT